MTVSLPSSRAAPSRTPQATEGAPAGNGGTVASTAVGTPQIRPRSTPEPQSRSSMNCSSAGSSAGGQRVAGDPGALKLGALDVRSDELKQLGATVNGEALAWTLATSGPAALQDDLVNRIQFGDAQVEGALKGPHSKRVLDILTGVALDRSSSAPLIRRRSGVPVTTVTAGDLINQKLRPITGALVGNKMGTNPVTMFISGEAAVQHTGVGLQVYGVMRNLADLSEALKKGETTAAVISGGAVAAEMASAGLEYSLPKLGAYLGRDDIPVLNAFNNSSLGKRFGGKVTATAGAGQVLGRGASVGGVVVALPWELASAVKSFTDASRSTGREAQDHYVEGGLAVASAVTTVGLTGATLAGVSSAGPIGAAVGVALALGDRIYKSVRQVQDLQDNTELTVGERLSAGVRGFLGAQQPQDILDRAAVGAANNLYRAQMKSHMLGLLAKSGDKFAIFGDAKIKARPPQDAGKSTHLVGKLGVNTVRHTKQVPAAVSPNMADDNIDASGNDKIHNFVRADLRANPNARDAVLWNTGHGNDTLRGPTHMPNHFELASGRKTITGGDVEDVFNLTGLPDAGSSFDGADGSDTLSLNIRLPRPGTSSPPASVQTRVSLPPDDAGLGTLEQGGVRLATLRSVENISTQAGGRTMVISNAKDNIFMMNGADVVKGGDGNDTYFVEGPGTKFIEPGAGENRYSIKPGTMSVIVGKPKGSAGRASRGSARIELGYGVGQLNVHARAHDLYIDTKGGERVTLLGVRESDAKEGWRPARPDGSLVIVTSDKWVITPNLHRAAGASRKVELMMESLADFERRTNALKADELTAAEAAEANARDSEAPIPNLLASLPAAGDGAPARGSRPDPEEAAELNPHDSQPPVANILAGLPAAGDRR